MDDNFFHCPSDYWDDCIMIIACEHNIQDLAKGHLKRCLTLEELETLRFLMDEVVGRAVIDFLPQISKSHNRAQKIKAKRIKNANVAGDHYWIL